MKEKKKLKHFEYFESDKVGETSIINFKKKKEELKINLKKERKKAFIL